MLSVIKYKNVVLTHLFSGLVSVVAVAASLSMLNKMFCTTIKYKLTGSFDFCKKHECCAVFSHCVSLSYPTNIHQCSDTLFDCN